MRQSVVISIFTFTIAFCVAFLYWFLRAGLAENSILIVLKVLGISAFILLLPFGLRYLTKQLKTEVRETFFNDTILPVYGLIFLGGVGYLTSVLQVNLAWVFVVAGYVFIFFTFRSFIQDLSIWSKVALILLGLFFGVWTGGICWFWYLKPFILEGWALGTDKVDTLFHIAIGQMIKTYGVPTTGLDGIPFMNYHFGSHFLFAQLSNLLNLPVIVIYQLGFPVIIAPLLFRTFLSFVLDLKQHYKVEATSKKINIAFWVIFLAIFIGFYTSFLGGNKWAEYAPAGTGLTLLMIASESYTLSLVIMLSIFSALINYWNHKTKLKPIHELTFLYFILPLSVVLSGFVKISTMLVICGLLGFFFLRLKLFKDRRFIISIIILVVTSLGIFTLVFETRENHGGFSWLYFYRYWHIPLFLFIISHYVWTYIFIALYAIREKLHRRPLRQLSFSNKLLPIESLLVVCLAGFLPTIFLRIQNYDSLYLTELQMYMAGALVLLYVPFYINRTYSRKAVLLLTVLCFCVFVVFFFNTKVYWRNLWKDTVRVHEELFHNGHFKGNIVRSLVIKAENRYDSIYSHDRVLSFLLQLKELDDLPIREKRTSLVYVDFRKLFTHPDYHWKLHCHNIAFIVPALSGIAMIDGIDVTYFELCPDCCEFIGLSYHYYPKWKSREQIDQLANLGDLMNRVKEKGFENLFFYNLEKHSFERKNVNDFSLVNKSI